MVRSAIVGTGFLLVVFHFSSQVRALGQGIHLSVSRFHLDLRFNGSLEPIGIKELLHKDAEGSPLILLPRIMLGEGRDGKGGTPFGGKVSRCSRVRFGGSRCR